MCPYLEKVIKDSEMGTLSWIFPCGKCPGKGLLPRDSQASGDDAECSQSVDMKWALGETLRISQRIGSRGPYPQDAHRLVQEERDRGLKQFTKGTGQCLMKCLWHMHLNSWVHQASSTTWKMPWLLHGGSRKRTEHCMDSMFPQEPLTPFALGILLV